MSTPETPRNYSVKLLYIFRLLVTVLSVELGVT